MEAWSAIQASCMQPVTVVSASVGAGLPPAAGSGEGDGVEDDCLLALKRLQDEASPPPTLRGSSSTGIAKAGCFHMQNLNPLGMHTKILSTGLTLPSSLTRAVLSDAMVVRRLVLDLDQAKAVRERTFFVQVRAYISRYTLVGPVLKIKCVL
jgi:hypothetical protein